MSQGSDQKKYDLEDRTAQFAKRVALFCKKLPKNMYNFEYAKQLIRSSSSIAANYIEANESLSKKDFVLRIKISRKESKESTLWLKLLMTVNEEIFHTEAKELFNEAIAFKKIFSAILLKVNSS